MRFFASLTTTHYRLLAGIWTVGILVALGLPTGRFSHVQPDFGVDKAVHAVLFAGFGVLWLRGLCPPGTRNLPRCFRWRGGLFFVAGLLFAAGTEAYQYVLPVRRMADPYDVTADLAGFVFAFVGYYAYHVRPARKAPS